MLISVFSPRQVIHIFTPSKRGRVGDRQFEKVRIQAPVVVSNTRIAFSALLANHSCEPSVTGVATSPLTSALLRGTGSRLCGSKLSNRPEDANTHKRLVS